MESPRIEWRTSSHSTQQGNCVEVGAWRRSSRSTDQGHCIEVGVRRTDTSGEGRCASARPWKTSSHSTGNGGECVEVAPDETMVLARDSKDPDGPVLGFGAGAWGTFLNTVKRGRHDLP
ncbi:DUF397 domain-containing protein [Actinomadura sp. GTD37]|uniref:DUF397 domain-containing protein n=1 Tax=Actinomadura sp. GTD37 TaxID=1778030 RepID=UPI0035BFB387